MAIRRPSISSLDWLFQDFLYQETPEGEERYILVKWDNEVYYRTSQSFDNNVDSNGGHIVAQLDYTVFEKLVTVNGWSVNWRDEWPLRLAMNYLSNCLYPSTQGYVIRAVGEQVYKSDGTPIDVGVKDPYAFLVSEYFLPVTNKPNDYFIQ